MPALTDLADLGREVARLRKAQGLTQAQVGALTGLGQSTLARFETGKVPEFGTAKLLRVLAVLGHGLAAAPLTRRFTLDDALAQRREDAGKAQTGP
ncbi:MAG: hypothetical protein RIS88_3046 [Pseudomonadota bacterium]|jgi:HTH-type transcriptional regulator/antitoxin HipB